MEILGMGMAGLGMCLVIAALILVSVRLYQIKPEIIFFFPEYTGLLITIASIFSFLVLMAVTSRIKWEKKF